MKKSAAERFKVIHKKKLAKVLKIWNLILVYLPALLKKNGIITVFPINL
jgi:hypothetical protein